MFCPVVIVPAALTVIFPAESLDPFAKVAVPVVPAPTSMAIVGTREVPRNFPAAVIPVEVMVPVVMSPVPVSRENTVAAPESRVPVV